MRFIYVRLKNYIGLYNGSGLNELVLDMSTCKNKIVLISGMNGSGKSTLQSALDILPDPGSSFIPGKPAEKELHILDSSGASPTIYRILITSPVSKAGRGASKASIQKNGIELNPNGNISSYKDIIFSEFELDGNYITLGQLSSTDRGLAGKLPTERKKFMSHIVDNLEVYNNIYKTLNKKSLIFKSSMNNLHTKIQNIGDESKLRSTLSVFKHQIDAIGIDMDAVKAKLAILDDWINQHLYYNGQFSEEDIKRIETDYTQQSRAMKLALDNFNSKASKLNCEASIEKIKDLKETSKTILDKATQEIEILKIKKAGLLSSLGSIESDKDLKMSKIDSLMQGINPEIMDQYKQANDTIDAATQYLKEIGIDYQKSSVSDIETLQDIVSEIIMSIDLFYTDTTEEIINMALDENLDTEYRNLNTEISRLTQHISNIKEHIEEMKKDYEIIKSVNDHRPLNCSIPDCWYIASAVNLANKYDSEGIDITKEIQKYEENLTSRENELFDLNFSKLPLFTIAKEKRVIYLKILDIIRINKNILHKYSKFYPKLNNLESFLRSHYAFSEYRDTDLFASAASALLSYQRNTELCNSLKADIKILENNTATANSLQEEIAELDKKAMEYRSQIGSIDSGITIDTGIIQTSNESLAKIESAISSYHNYEELSNKFMEVSSMYESIKNTNMEAMSKIQERNEYQARLEKLIQQKESLYPQIFRINGMLTMLGEYQTEYNQIKEKYRTIELVKKYTSPASGIQTLFIEVYMNKALDLANQILGMIFSGEYQLMNFVINQNEFRIPFIGSGLPVDDISSGSTSQICIIGMIINLVLLHQASVKFNIPRLDEIDGGLDSRNKLDFINILYKTSDLLGIEQMFMISHSAELELQNVDIIRLRSYEDHEINPNFNGTIIYDFNQSISTTGTSL